MNNLLNIVKKFKIEGNVLSVEQINDGLINKTYYVCTDANRKYVLQQINNFVFKKPYEIMENIVFVTNHLKEQNGNVDTLELIATSDEDYILKINNDIYRMYKYINDSFIVSIKELNENVTFEVGKIIGDFHSKLSNLNVDNINETIIDFHNTPSRIEQLFSSYYEKQHYDEEIIDQYINYVKNNVDLLNIIETVLEAGKLKKTIIHNDTKLNNIMFDINSKKAKCLIDFDTIMPGTILYDIGDALRSLISSVREDDSNFDEIMFNEKRLYCFIIGYLSNMHDKITKLEVELIPLSVYTITMECSIRFMTDYLNENQYFHVDYPKHNLVRALNQLILANQIKNKLEVLKKNTLAIYNKLSKKD